MKSDLPFVLAWDEIHLRLQVIFPEGTPERSNCTSRIAASTVFVALYVGAVEGNDIYFSPLHVYRMTDEQANSTGEASRRDYISLLQKRGYDLPGVRWYQDNTREVIRDNTLRQGLLLHGSVQQISNIPTTSSKPRYFLSKEFAALFGENELAKEQVLAFRTKYFSVEAKSRIASMKDLNSPSLDEVTVIAPGGETRLLAAGESSKLAKGVIEELSQQLFQCPQLLWLSESRRKVYPGDRERCSGFGIQIKEDKILPDIILAERLGSFNLVIFVEIVASDGPITEERKNNLMKCILPNPALPVKVAFITAFRSRTSAPFKKSLASLAWNSSAWFLEEPKALINLSRLGETLVLETIPGENFSS